MAANFCLPPTEVDKFTDKLKDGSIDPARLADMTSAERHDFFSKITGEANAKGVNALFESKMLLKNQKYAYVSWAKKVAGLTPEVRQDMITKIGKLDHVLDPADEKQFLHDLASTKLGIDVTQSEAKQIADMSQKVTDAQAKQGTDGTFKSEADRLAYGYAKVDLGNHISELKNAAAKPALFDIAKHPAQSLNRAASLSKSIKASLDDSAIFRQGWKTLLTNPKIWQKNARQSFVDLVRQVGNKNVMREVNADIASRPNFDKYTKMKLAIGNIEEEFPTALPEKVPVLGRLYKASESAYTGFLYRQRADIADKMLDIAKKSGVDINDKAQLQSMGKMINALTGRGDLGRFEGKAADALNNLFFSARFLKGNIDTLTAHQLQKGVTPFVRKQAALNLLKVVSGSAAVMGIANAVKPGSVELDPRSKDFGKIKIGDTRFDVTGGISALATLAGQVLTQQTKSGTTGIISKLNSGYGSQTGVDVINNFFENKLSPAASFVKDMVKQQDFNGNRPTLKGEAANLLIPLPITTYSDLKSDPHAANPLLSLISDSLGISTSTYGKSTKNYAMNPSPTLQAFQAKVGAATFKQANTEYNTKYDQWFNSVKSRINTLPNNQKQPIITSAKAKIQASIYKQYDFKPPKNQKTLDQKATSKSLLQMIK